LLRQHGSVAEAAASVPLSDDTRRLSARVDEWLAADARRSVLLLGDADYPQRLLESPDPPLLLYLEGQRAQLRSYDGFAVVGSRHPTPQGLDHARHFAAELAAAGYALVSGLALGIDGAAHHGALTQGVSWAVLGSGLDVVHPRSHRALAETLRNQGLLISEHPPGTEPLPAHFPVRNRIIAGLSVGVLVVEAAEQSGSLITARLAADAGREVFALPGPIRSLQSRGCHRLIQQGAKLVQDITDLLPELPPSDRAAAPVAPEAPAAPETASVCAQASDPLLDALGWEPCSLESLQARCGLATDTLLARLLDLELEGRVRRLGGGRFERCGLA
jgi:DNA processing protein